MEPNQSPLPPETSPPEPAAGAAPLSQVQGPPAAESPAEAPAAPPADAAPPAAPPVAPADRGRGPGPRGAGPSSAGGGRERGEGRDRDRDRRGQKQFPRPQGQGQGQGPGRPGGGPPREGRGPARPPHQHQPWSKPDFLARAVESGIDRSFIEGALEFGRSLGPSLGAGQVRSIYGEVMRQEIAGFDPARFLLLKPRLAYLAARAGRSEMRELRTVLDRGVEKVCAEGIPDEERQARFERFARCLEAILAYHKSYERKQGERA